MLAYLVMKIRTAYEGLHIFSQLVILPATFASHCTLPDDNRAPTEFVQGCQNPLVPIVIALQFVPPERLILGRISEQATTMRMPKAAMDEYHCFPACELDVGSAGQSLNPLLRRLHAKAETSAMQEPPDPQFRLGVP